MSSVRSSAQDVISVIERFNAAFESQDLDAVMGLMTSDCRFENTMPPPDGARHDGQDAVRAAFAEFFGSSPGARFEIEECFAAEDRCVVRWIYRWKSAGGEGHIRGVDLFRVVGDLVAEKLSYVKG